MHSEQAWIESNGGPLIVLAEPLLPAWRGADAPLVGATDYERACEIGEVGLLQVGVDFGLVLGDEPLATRVYRHPSGCVLARWRFAESDAAVHSSLANPFHDLDWRLITTFTTFGGPQILFDSAFPGDDIIGERARFALDSGSYVVELAEYTPDVETALQLVRLR